MGWRLARSLEVLRAEVNALAPGRSKASDGTIGDTAHQASRSDHNPNSADVVCALDLTHDPAGGADMSRIADHIRTHRHPALKYVIFNRRIASAASGWAWRPYNGSNPHAKHMHVSAGTGPDGQSTGRYDDTSPWGLAASGGDEMLGLRRGDRGERVEALQHTLAAAGHSPGAVDGDYGPQTSAAVLAMRRAAGSVAAKDGDKITPATYAQLLEMVARRNGGGGKEGPKGDPGPEGPPGKPGPVAEIDYRQLAAALLAEAAAQPRQG